MTVRILIADNNDSFSGNIAQMLEALGCPFELSPTEAQIPGGIRSFGGVIISPGPGTPSEMPKLLELVAMACETRTPTLGICLGHQAICAHFGARLSRISPAHGVQTPVRILDGQDPLFRGIGSGFPAGRYHSWIAEMDGMDPEMSASAEDASGIIMAVRHKRLPIFGLQFHPESILTPDGGKIVANWLEFAREYSIFREKLNPENIRPWARLSKF